MITCCELAAVLNVIGYDIVGDVRILLWRTAFNPSLKTGQWSTESKLHAQSIDTPMYFLHHAAT